VSPDFLKLRGRIITILQEESKLMEIVKLIGSDTLPDYQKLVLETAHAIRIGFLQQDALDDRDTYVPIEKQKKMMETFDLYYSKAKELIAAGIPLSTISQSGLYEKLIKMKVRIPNGKPELFDDLMEEICNTLDSLAPSKSGTKKP
ncbi:MAG TPA: V-type ATP synthase subunit A, partial [Clostridia bacterium]|nr:V-type ATP synthase subunit A [Clostridia bacterium]